MKRKINAALLQGNVVVFTASQMILLSLLPYVAEKAGLALAHVAFAFSFGSFLFLFSSPLWGFISDRWGRQQVITIGVLGLCFSNILIVLLGSGISAELLLWGGRIIYGLSASAIVPVTQALLIDQADDGESNLKPLIKNSIALNTGRALGPAYLLLSSLLFLNFQSSLLYLTVFCACLAVLNMFLKVPVRPSSAYPQIAMPRLTILQWGALSMGFVFSVFVGTLNTSLAQIFIQRLGINAKQAGALMAQVLFASAVLAVLIQLVLKRFSKNPWRGLMVMGGVALALGSLFLSRLSDSFDLPYVVLFLSAGLCILPPCYIGIVTQGRQQLGLKTSLVGMISTLGYAAGGTLLSLFLWLQIRIENLVLLVGLVLLSSILLLQYLKSKESCYDVLS